MWILLALSLLLLQWNKRLSLVSLLLAVIFAIRSGVLAWPAWSFILLLFLAAVYSRRIPRGRYRQVMIEGVMLISAVALMLHVIPGFNNLRVLHLVQPGPESMAFSMYFNFDKALVPFVLLVGLRTLFVSEPQYRPSVWLWGLLVLAVPALLLIAVVAGGLKFEPHQPSWLLQFMLANIFFVSLAEEALFRGYLQQRLGKIMPPVAALIISAGLFGAVHYAGGTLLMIFATLAGVIYGLAWMWSGRLWVAVLFHFGLNLCHLLFFTYPVMLKAAG
ncbi:CPBP family intramembrane glutamic endopeptidase [Enterobacillus tribolii]|uniref:CPBP family intramembrane glutamic endopeptidase n=1 Tax=Enterobacillus tribolii TaxID=1487935 RepID=UPI000E1CC924|nr:CPBP family intramembrane glutamic endopeptidase [Enterobacillus tribolii]MBW7983449.1 CPBP family intramembrane metalloprotease [Enterobacillus tribolii]